MNPGLVQHKYLFRLKKHISRIVSDTYVSPNRQIFAISWAMCAVFVLVDNFVQFRPKAYQIWNTTPGWIAPANFANEAKILNLLEKYQYNLYS